MLIKVVVHRNHEQDVFFVGGGCVIEIVNVGIRVFFLLWYNTPDIWMATSHDKKVKLLVHQG
jgi:hypothetical protein